MRAFVLLALLAVPASAIDIEREDYKVIGWNDSCGVAIERYGYPYFGEAIYNEPITVRVGTLSVELKSPIVITRWVLETNGTNTWDPKMVGPLRRKLRKAGFDRQGFTEIIRDSETVVSPGSAEVILSTAILDARPDFWPDTTVWRFARVNYNPLTTCALLLYEKIGEPERYKTVLTRIYNPSARADRGRAHAVNGRLLFNKGDLPGALAEAEIAAKMAPEVSGVRYQYAAMLAMSGRADEAMKELLVAVDRDQRFAAKAADDLDFESLRHRADFHELVLRKPIPPEPGVPTLPP